MVVKKYESTDGLITIEVDEELCEGLKDCIEVCPSMSTTSSTERPYRARIDDCIECCQCVDSCPKNAIKHSSC